ncbi:MAG: transposase [Deltaproteobacteria bacterium]|nr:transposase [Deltaproteobacteria bacterium]
MAAVDAMGVTLYGPVPERGENDPFKLLMTDTAAVTKWRKRMKTAAAQEIYKQRAPTSERVNADVRTHRTMDRMLVRGASKVLCVGLWNAIAFNVLRWLALAPIS